MFAGNSLGICIHNNLLKGETRKLNGEIERYSNFSDCIKLIEFQKWCIICGKQEQKSFFFAIKMEVTIWNENDKLTFIQPRADSNI